MSWLSFSVLHFASRRNYSIHHVVPATEIRAAAGMSNGAVDAHGAPFFYLVGQVLSVLAN
jgi:hypothetical protein